MLPPSPRPLFGDNPNGKGLYRFHTPSHVRSEDKNLDFTGWHEKIMRPISLRPSFRTEPALMQIRVSRFRFVLDPESDPECDLLNYNV